MMDPSWNHLERATEKGVIAPKDWSVSAFERFDWCMREIEKGNADVLVDDYFALPGPQGGLNARP